jgi:hypothetical protein
MDTALTPLQQLLQYLPFIIPIVLIQLVLMIVCLVDLFRREKTRYLPKWAWAIIIIIGELLGPIVYLILGRED